MRVFGDRIIKEESGIDQKEEGEEEEEEEEEEVEEEVEE